MDERGGRGGGARRIGPPRASCESHAAAPPVEAGTRLRSVGAGGSPSVRSHCPWRRDARGVTAARRSLEGHARVVGALAGLAGALRGAARDVGLRSSPHTAVPLRSDAGGPVARRLSRILDRARRRAPRGEPEAPQSARGLCSASAHPHRRSAARHQSGPTASFSRSCPPCSSNPATRSLGGSNPGWLVSR